MDNIENNVRQIIGLLGGASNISAVTNCMTRLRTVVKDESLADTEKLKALPDVLGVVHDRECAFEIVVGPGKCRKYADCCRAMGVASGTGMTAKPSETGDKDKKARLRSALKIVGDIFVPMIPGVITAGLCAGFASLLTQLVPDYADNTVWSTVYNLLSLISTSFTMYITAWAGYRAAERFGATPILGGMLGMITSLDGINKIASLVGLYNESQPLDSILRAGKGGVLAVIFGVFVLSVIEKKIRKIIPDSVDIIFTPFLSLLICVIPYIAVIMPLFGYISGGIAWLFGQFCMSDSIIMNAIVGYISAAVFLPLVATGMHHGLVALYTVQLQELGYVTLYPALCMAGAGQVGAAIAMYRKARRVGNTDLRRVINGALPTGLLGVGEPLIYGVTLPYGKPFITAGLGAGFGGALVMATRIASSTWGPSGLLGVFVMTEGPNGAAFNAVIYISALVLSYVGGFIFTDIFVKDSELRISENSEAAAPAENRLSPGQTVTVGNGTVAAPAAGILVAMEDIPDSTFSSATLGQCFGIIPDNGEVYSPCDGVVESVADTLHALTITASDGRELLVHVGIDTVKLHGKGFNVKAAPGDKVTSGQLLMSYDPGAVQDAGLSPMIITVICE